MKVREVVVTSFTANRTPDSNADVEARVAAKAARLGEGGTPPLLITNTDKPRFLSSGACLFIRALRRGCQTLQSAGQKGLWFIVLLDDGQARTVRQSWSWTMTRVCAVITNRIVVPVRVDVDVAVPMIANGIVNIVKRGVVLVWGKPAAVSVLFHAVTPGAIVVWCTRDTAMVDWKWQVWGSRQIIDGWIAMAESAVEVKGRN